jgi:predicted nuclease of predicted toxin-antitoxin system
MRVLLDECVPKRLRSELSSHSVRTVTEMGWAGIKNGQLLKKAAAEFDCFLTVDRNLQFQQSVDSLPLAVLVIRAADNRIETLRPRMVMVREGLASIGANELKVIGT